VRGQAEHVAGLISLASLILLAYVAGNVALELQRLGSQIAGEVQASKELLEVVRVNEAYIEIRSRWDGDSHIKYLILCNAYVCNLTSADAYVPRRGSAVVALLNGSSDTNQVCVITANENMFCADPHTASTREPNQAQPQPRNARYVAERVPPMYAFRPNVPTYQDSNVVHMWIWRQSKYPLISNEGIYIYAYPSDQAFFVTELDDLLPSLDIVISCDPPQFPSQNGLIWIKNCTVGTPKVYDNVTKMFDRDDATSTSFIGSGTYFMIDLGQVYTSGVFVITLAGFSYVPSPGTSATMYFGTEPWNPTAYSVLFMVTSSDIYNPPNLLPGVPLHVKGTYNGTVAFWVDSIPGGVRYIWLNASYLNIASVEFYPSSAFKSYITATDPLVPQGLDVYPRTITALAVPGTSLRIIEEIIEET